MNIFYRKFTTGEVIEATGVTNDAIQNWIKRDLLIGQKTSDEGGDKKSFEGGGRKGRNRYFSLFGVMEIAIAQAILTAGGLTDLKDVFQAASHFAHTGEGPLPGKPARIPGLPFHVPGSATLVIAGKGWSDEIMFTAEDSIFELAAPILNRGGCMVIDASEVFDVTLRKLGIDPAQVMKQGYEGCHV